ncbi:hypothetical protein ACFC08_35680 [Streptomyces sp. NPDC056112]|uniref:hypothetical protein n=1 Tax=Streptomyces sp. NPDC056112 TaxID=3345715 RepID=UPI0035E1B3C0
MSQLPTTTTASSTIPEQAITASLTAEVMTDLDDGQPMLVASTQPGLGDLQVVTPTQLLAKVAEQRQQLDRIEALANEYAATVVIPAFLEEYGIELEELDLANLAEDAPDLAAQFRAFSIVKNDGTVIVAVPKGQAPVERLAAIRDLVLDLQKQAAQS